MATKTWVEGRNLGQLGAGADVALSGQAQVRSVSLAGPTAVLELCAANSNLNAFAPAPTGNRVGGGIVLIGSSDPS